MIEPNILDRKLKTCFSEDVINDMKTTAQEVAIHIWAKQKKIKNPSWKIILVYIKTKRKC